VNTIQASIYKYM